MIRLRAQGTAHGIPTTLLGRVAPGCTRERLTLSDAVTLGDSPSALTAITLMKARLPSAFDTPALSEIDTLDYLEEGDVVAVHPSGRIDTLFRVASQNNGLFATEQCNSKCLMCSQPPRDVDDMDYFVALNKALISFLPDTLPTLGMTGGEPTLLGDRFIEILSLVCSKLPSTQFEVLSNGRAFAQESYAEDVARASTPRVLFSIPLYSDYPPQHDFVVQARGAFAETVRGLHNLAHFGVRAEVRVVLHRQSVARLAHLADFVQRNLPFIEHVALMGMEHTGFARLHDDLLWMEPPEYEEQLQQAVYCLVDSGHAVSLYNLQPCLVARDLWPFLRTSISDWKRQYVAACEHCSMRSSCGGVFGTSKRQSALIRAIGSM